MKTTRLFFFVGIKYICLFVFTILTSSLLLSCSSAEDKLVRQSLEDFLYDVSQKKADHFKIASKEKLVSLGIDEKTWSEDSVITTLLTNDENEISKQWQEILEKLHDIMKDDGFDWNSYTIQSFHYGKAYVMADIQGVESYGAIGTVVIESNGKEYEYSFLITIANGESLYVNKFDDKTLNLS